MFTAMIAFTEVADSQEVRRQLRPRLLLGDLLHSTHQPPAGVVDHDIEPPERGHCLVDDAEHCGPIIDIEWHDREPVAVVVAQRLKSLGPTSTRDNEITEVGPHVDLSVGLELIIGAVFHRWLLRTGPLDEAYADTLVNTVMHALEPRAASI